MKHSIPRPHLIAAIGTNISTRAAARALGFHDGTGLRARLKAEGITVRRVCPQGAQCFAVIEDRR